MDVAWFAQQHFLSHLDLLKVWKYCMVHDKPETYAGDTPTFRDKNGIFNGPDRATKKDRERLATLRLRKEWGSQFPDFLASLAAYELQDDEESRFVYAVDKLLSLLNILEDNGRSDKVLGVTLEEKKAILRPRVASHPFVLELFDELVAFLSSRPDMFIQTTADKPLAAE